MKNHLREMVGISLIFISIFLFAATFVIAEGDTTAPGQKIFETKCAQCHGKDAKGVNKMVGLLKVDPALLDLTRAEAVTLSKPDLEKIVANGKKKMPKYKGKLTEAQIQNAVEYLGTLQGTNSAK